MSYEKWFTYRHNEERVNINGYFVNPSTLTQDRIDYMDQNAARCIAEARELIEDLTQYRSALAARYAQLASAPYRLRLELERCPEGWQRPRIWYYVRIRKIYEDGTEVMDLEERYPGPERRAAFARFEELKKQRPGIELLRDTEKRSWER